MRALLRNKLIKYKKNLYEYSCAIDFAKILAMDQLSLLSEIIKEKPSILYGDALLLARKNGWLVDYDGCNQDLLNTPAWLVIHQLRISLIQADRLAISREAAFTSQFVETGSYKTFRSVLNSIDLNKLLTLSDQYHRNARQAPLSLESEAYNNTIFDKDLAIRILRNILSSNELSLLGHRQFTVLTNRCLLRRTFSGKFNPVKHGNINNQMWHQDSNRSFDSKPMLTLWIPLQDGSSINRPGLQVSGLEPKIFNHRFGDSCTESDLKAYYKVQDICPSTPSDLQAGDCLIFNGLTYHQTYLNSSMKLSRDVLLIRVCAKCDSKSFPGDISKRLDFTI